MSREHPADTLRRAAALVRTVLTDADTGEDWEESKHYDDMSCVDFMPSIPNAERGYHRYLPDDPDDPGVPRPADIYVHYFQARHIALWQPAGVAQGIARWLEACADAWPTPDQVVYTTTPARSRERQAALDLALALLKGEPAQEQG